MTHYANDSATAEWLRLMADMATGRDEPEPHQQKEDQA